MLNFIIFGPQGSGKSTQAKLLAEKLDLLFISTGEIVRDLYSKKTELGKKAEQYAEKGILVPDDLITEILRRFLNDKGKQKGYVFDGYPRNANQVPILDQIVKEKEGKIDKVFLINVGEEECLKRLKKRVYLEQREDETPQAIKRRLRAFWEQTTPIFEVYKKRGILEEIDGERSIEEINEEIMEKVGGEEYLISNS